MLNSTGRESEDAIFLQAAINKILGQRILKPRQHTLIDGFSMQKLTLVETIGVCEQSLQLSKNNFFGKLVLCVVIFGFNIAKDGFQQGFFLWRDMQGFVYTVFKEGVLVDVLVKLSSVNEIFMKCDVISIGAEYHTLENQPLIGSGEQ